MQEPAAEPMPWPGYEPPTEGRRLLEWTWAVTRLQSSLRFWLATTGPSGAPHLAAVWGVWTGGALVFSTGQATRKALNLASQQECSIATESAEEAVVLDGVAVEVRTAALMKAADDAYIAKYGATMLAGDSVVFAVRPRNISGIVDSSPSFLPTRWRL